MTTEGCTGSRMCPAPAHMSKVQKGLRSAGGLSRHALAKLGVLATLWIFPWQSPLACQVNFLSVMDESKHAYPGFCIAHEL